MGIDLIASLAGLIIPGALDLVKRLFIKGPANEEETLATLATTKPETLAEYVKAMVEMVKAKVMEFNRDIVGIPSQIVVDIRASIRPLATIVALGALIGDGLDYVTLNDGVRYTFEIISSSWFGSRLLEHK